MRVSPMRLALNRAPMSLPANTSRRMRAHAADRTSGMLSETGARAVSDLREGVRLFGTVNGARAAGSAVSGAVSGRHMSLFFIAVAPSCLRIRVAPEREWSL